MFTVHVESMQYEALNVYLAKILHLFSNLQL